MIDPKVKLYTLIKLISYVKFESREYESQYFAGSPIVGEILSDLKIQFSSEKEINFEVKIDNPFRKTLINAIHWHLEQTDEWSSMINDDKFEHIENLASPYILEKEVILSIMKERDSYIEDSTK